MLRDKSRLVIVGNPLVTVTLRRMEEVLNPGREDAIDELLDENAVIHGLEGTGNILSSFKNNLPKYRQCSVL